MYIKNHGLPKVELDRAFAISKSFYDLPLEDKMKAPHPPGWKVHRGYSMPGLEKVSNALASDRACETKGAEVKALREVGDCKVRADGQCDCI